VEEAVGERSEEATKESLQNGRDKVEAALEFEALG
jgi:hypothetical protein